MGGGGFGGGEGASTVMPSISSSAPLSGAQRSEIFQAALRDLGPYLPDRSEYRGYEIVDPSADRGRGDIYNDSKGNMIRGYEGYSNRQPIEQTAGQSNASLRSTLDSYFAELKKQIGSGLGNQGQAKESDTDRFTYYDELAKIPGVPDYTSGMGPGWYDSKTGQTYSPVTSTDQYGGTVYDRKNLPPEVLSLMAQRRG